MPNIFQRIFQFATTPAKPKTPVVNTAIKAGYGTRFVSGLIDEDHIAGLSGPDWMEKVDKMRRSDPQCKMICNAVQNTMRGALIDIRPWTSDENDPFYKQAQEDRDFMEFLIFENMDRPWPTVWNEITTFPLFGYAPFWEINKYVKDHPDWGDFIGIHSLRYISQKSVEKWEIDPLTGELLGIEQLIQGDTSERIKLDADFLHVFTNELEGSNFEGISILRSCYGNYFRKKTYLILEAIGTERDALKVPIVTVPAGKEKGDEYTRMELVVKKLYTSESKYIMLPEGWKIDFVGGDYDPSKIRISIDKEDVAIARAILGNVLNLGQDKAGGSRALGDPLLGFMLKGFEYLGGIPCTLFNYRLIPRMMKINNRGDRPGYPYAECTGISDEASKELAETLDKLKGGGTVGNWGKKDVAHTRNRFKLLEEQEVENEEANGPPKPTKPPPGKAPPDEGKEADGDQEGEVEFNRFTESIRFADKPNVMIEKGAEGLQDVMLANLRYVKEKLINDIIAKWQKLGPNAKAKAIKDIEAKGVKKYTTALKSSMISLAIKALNNVSRENKKIKSAKFDFRMADPLAINQGFKISEMKKLSKNVRDNLEIQAKITAETQAADLEKRVFFSFNTNVSREDSAARLITKMDEAADGVLVQTGPASKIASSKIVNETRKYFFFEKEIEKQIDSFTFRNAAPVTAICTELNGKTFGKNDAKSMEFWPPLHHNCKSYVEANEEGSKALEKAKANKDPKDGKLRPTATARKDVTLSGCCGTTDESKSKLSQELAMVFNKDWISLQYPVKYTLQALNFDPNQFSLQSAENYVKNLEVTSSIVSKGERFLAETRNPKDFKSLHLVDIGQGVKATVGMLKNETSSHPPSNS